MGKGKFVEGLHRFYLRPLAQNWSHDNTDKIYSLPNKVSAFYLSKCTANKTANSDEWAAS